MEQYIRKDALINEIGKQIGIGKLKCQKAQENNDYESFVSWSERIDTYGEILSFINSLEVKDGDFETAFAALIDHFDEKNSYGQWPESDLRNFAEHFFELGLNNNKIIRNENR